MQKFILLSILCVFALTNFGFAQAPLSVEITGVVQDNFGVTTGPWAASVAGIPITMRFDLVDHFTVSPGHSDRYNIDTSTFELSILGTTIGMASSPWPPKAVTVTNDLPVADVFIFDFELPINEPDHFVFFELHDSSGLSWNVSDLATAPGSYPTSGFDSIEFFVFAGAGTLALTPTTINFSIPTPPTQSFVRGDINDDGTFNIADAIFALEALFGTQTQAPCDDAADSNDDGLFNLADVITSLGSLFGASSTVLPSPFTICGPDPTSDALDCTNFAGCP